MDEISNPYTPRGNEAQRGYPTPRRKWDPPKRICDLCGVRPVYQPDVETMDWCEQCIWEFVQEDQVLVPDYAPDGGEEQLSGATRL
jgi:hypothetical protein